jgi:hypothetical protein
VHTRVRDGPDSRKSAEKNRSTNAQDERNKNLMGWIMIDYRTFVPYGRSMTQKTIDPDRHARECKICAHPDRDEIEEKFVDWEPQSRMVREHGISRLSLHRHARATGLIAKRDANLRASLAKFIERAYSVRPTAASYVSAIVAYSKIDGAGRTIDRSETVGGDGSLAEKFAQMNRGELLEYAESGKLPAWWTGPNSAAGSEGV